MLGLGNNLARGGVLSGLENNYSLDFDGTDDYVDCGGDIDITGAFTISAWINTDTIGASPRNIACQGNSIFGLSYTAEGILIYQGQGSSGNNLLTQTPLVIDTWYHIVLSVAGTDAGDGKIYIDGVRDDDNATTVFMTAGDFQIGKMPNADIRYWDGNIDEVAIWNKVLSAGDISALYSAKGTANLNDDGNSANLQGWWRMGDGVLDSHPLIADQVNPTLGSDAVEADTADLGSFDTDTTSSWTANNAIAYNSGTGDATVTHDGSGAWIMARNFLTSGQVYKATFKAKATANTSYLSLTNGAGAGHYYGATLNPALSTSYQNYEFLLKTKSTWLEFSASSSATSYSGADPDSGDTFTFDDIVVKPVNGNAGFMTNMASDDIVKDTP